MKPTYDHRFAALLIALAAGLLLFGPGSVGFKCGRSAAEKEAVYSADASNKLMFKWNNRTPEKREINKPDLNAAGAR